MSVFSLSNVPYSFALSFPGKKKALSEYGPAAATPAAAADDDDIDLFGSDDEDDAEAERLKEQRLSEYRAKKAAKPKVIAKSSIVLDVKPWDDETDMKVLEEGVRAINMQGLLWGACKICLIFEIIFSLCIVTSHCIRIELFIALHVFHSASQIGCHWLWYQKASNPMCC